MAHTNNEDNLISLGDRPEEERKEIARKGGIASGKARQEKATMKATLEKLLEETNKKGIKYKDLSILGLIKGGIQGKAENIRLMLQMLGELNQEEQTITPQVNINIVDHSDLEKALYEDENE